MQIHDGWSWSGENYDAHSCNVVRATYKGVKINGVHAYNVVRVAHERVETTVSIHTTSWQAGHDQVKINGVHSYDVVRAANERVIITVFIHPPSSGLQMIRIVFFRIVWINTSGAEPLTICVAAIQNEKQWDESWRFAFFTAIFSFIQSPSGLPSALHLTVVLPCYRLLINPNPVVRRLWLACKDGIRFRIGCSSLLWPIVLPCLILLFRPITRWRLGYHAIRTLVVIVTLFVHMILRGPVV